MVFKDTISELLKRSDPEYTTVIEDVTDVKFYRMTKRIVCGRTDKKEIQFIGVNQLILRIFNDQTAHLEESDIGHDPLGVGLPDALLLYDFRQGRPPAKIVIVRDIAYCPL
jgi:hypothetical protein